MSRFLNRILLPLAITVAVTMIVTAGLRVYALLNISALTGQSDFSDLGFFLTPPHVDTGNACYPYPWQWRQRERLRALMKRPYTPPDGTNELSLARYAAYALNLSDNNTNYEKVMREGMRRDPDNALYHNLLANSLIRRALDGETPVFDKTTGKVTFAYQVVDRKLLDRGMRELAIGCSKPYRSRTDTIITAQLNAMPEPRHLEDQLRNLSVMSGAMFPVYAKMRNLERVNSFYLSLLLAEGKQKEAEPYLHTGEHLAIQIVRDDPPTLVGIMVALSITKMSSNCDAAVCRQYGFKREATELQTRHAVLTGKAKAWKESITKMRPAQDRLMRHAGIIGSMLLPGMGNLNTLTPENLAPSRLIEYTVVEEAIGLLLPVIFFLLLIFTGLKRSRWRFAAQTGSVIPDEAGLSRRGWMSVILAGLVSPLALYLLYATIPALSRRDLNIITAMKPLAAGNALFILWLLMAPAIVTAIDVWRRHVANRQTEVTHGWKIRGIRLFASVIALCWLLMAALLMFGISNAALIANVVDRSQTSPPSELTLAILINIPVVLLLLEMAVLPALTKGTCTHMAAYYHTLSRTMVQVYAVLILLTAPLYPALCLLERHYLRTDTVLGVMQEGNTVAFTYAEGQLALHLRGYVNEGAEKLGMK